MNDPLRRFKSQPWKPLSQVAGLTTLLVILIEGVLSWILTQSDPLPSSLSPLLSPPLGIIVTVAAAVGVGILGVYICERWQSQAMLNTASLWALILCLIVGLVLKSLLPLPAILVRLSFNMVVGVVVGVFWKGRPYWH
ncbi:MAG: peptide chain release factor 1 [Cyanobacteria bacterium QH_9_48_43]|nr:MAG: peptide chain release factor 1 [Cyanobacteria bacterium QH_9_48_43]PSO87281.1 MAG: peptide chain release factor 1 [Cyanobacteria bacterium QS_3_48_167]PSO87510.1 MAG: peptide chain release factor 1 [Cyanobacteria bacterium QS_5_48_63]PSO88512.1 MAG: peptide chain release factor 1 [Cyanobacteria bacterium QS_6_48_18]PSP09617.1 MAG: peptide chain release factor 1 [Cyanobacteria bacterium SW_10_48_33]